MLLELTSAAVEEGSQTLEGRADQRDLEVGEEAVRDLASKSEATKIGALVKLLLHHVSQPCKALSDRLWVVFGFLTPSK